MSPDYTMTKVSYKSAAYLFENSMLEVNAIIIRYILEAVLSPVHITELYKSRESMQRMFIGRKMKVEFSK